MGYVSSGSSSAVTTSHPARVIVFMGSADPFAHNFVTPADSADDETGRLDVEVERHLPPSCQAGEVGIFASGESESSRRKAIFTVTGR